MTGGHGPKWCGRRTGRDSARARKSTGQSGGHPGVSYAETAAGQEGSNAARGEPQARSVPGRSEGLPLTAPLTPLRPL